MQMGSGLGCIDGGPSIALDIVTFANPRKKRRRTARRKREQNKQRDRARRGPSLVVGGCWNLIGKERNWSVKKKKQPNHILKSSLSSPPPRHDRRKHSPSECLAHISMGSTPKTSTANATNGGWTVRLKSLPPKTTLEENFKSLPWRTTARLALESICPKKYQP